MRDDRERLRDILEAIERIERYTSKGREEFMQDELIQTWVVHHIQIIGEAARKLSEEARSEHDEVPWPAIIAMRNILVHDYFSVDIDEVWSTIERDIPPLKVEVSSILEE
ncbi:MAG: nucleotidyltransferase [Candidatus Solincola sediminis]|nr:MAG: nucleotidyltransferase [Candidatus Solincola sediminis]